MVLQSSLYKFESNRSSGSWVMIGHTNRQTNKGGGRGIWTQQPKLLFTTLHVLNVILIAKEKSLFSYIQLRKNVYTLFCSFNRKLAFYKQNYIYFFKYTIKQTISIPVRIYEWPIFPVSVKKKTWRLKTGSLRFTINKTLKQKNVVKGSFNKT